MFVREMMYYYLPRIVIDKRLEKISAKLKSETTSREKMKILDETADIVKALIRKNRKNKKFLDQVGESMNELLKESELKMDESRY